ncbi:unnamed protein product [Paramecium sonneborni]|uniref:Uncharacterized protein n=1 Tax=Paramecium sonneborni TaxID=65129 RepID=A0A8S1RG71_9CILI|nr:unnamed protein product [Paramecium sonneborni]
MKKNKFHFSRNNKTYINSCFYTFNKIYFLFKKEETIQQLNEINQKMKELLLEMAKNKKYITLIKGDLIELNQNYKASADCQIYYLNNQNQKYYFYSRLSTQINTIYVRIKLKEKIYRQFNQVNQISPNFQQYQCYFLNPFTFRILHIKLC